MHWNRALSREIENTNQPSFIPRDALRVHKGNALEFKFKARNQNAHDIDSVMNSTHNTLYNLIHNNRKNTTQKVSVGIIEHFSKPKEVLKNDKDLVDPVTGIIHKKGTISIPTNEKVYDDKYHHSNVFTLYPRSSIRKLLDDLTTFLIQNREDNVARLEGASNRKLDFLENIYVKIHKINPPSTRSFVPTPTKLADKTAIINLKNKDDKCFLYATGISVFSDELGNKNLERTSKKLLKCCEQLNIDNINFPPSIKDIEQFEKDNPDISITIFEYSVFHKIKEDGNSDDNTKEGIVIKDYRVSPHALKRKHLVELLIIKDKIKGIDTNEIIEKEHFTTIKSISRLFRGSKYNKGLYYCKKRYCSFQSEKKLEIYIFHYVLMLKMC